MRLAGFLGSDLHDVDSPGSTIKNPVGNRLSGTLIGLSQFCNIPAYLAYAYSHHSSQDPMNIPAEPVAFIRQFRNLIFIFQLAEHNRIPQIRKAFAPPSFFQFFPGLLLYRHCQKPGLHIFRELGGGSMYYKTAVPGSLKNNPVIGKIFPDFFLIQLPFYQSRIKIRPKKRQRFHIMFF